LSQAPTDSGGPSISQQILETGNWKLGHEDYEETTKEEETKEEEIADEDLSNWVFETQVYLHGLIEEVVTLADKMYSFSSTTRNVHKDIKGWCAELKVKMNKMLEASETLKPYVDKAGDRYWTSRPPCWKRAYGKSHQL